MCLVRYVDVKMSFIDIILDYSNKNLKVMPKKVLEMYNLKMLYLEGNALQALPDNIFEVLRKLTWVDLRNNRLKSIPACIARHTSLETLLLQNNQIEQLPNELGIVPNLRVLQLSGNPITYPPREIIESGTSSVCEFLKREFDKINEETISEQALEREIAVTEFETYSNVISKNSVKEVLKLSSQNSTNRNVIVPSILVKSLSRNPSDDHDVKPKREGLFSKSNHTITKNRSTTSVHSQTHFNSNKYVESDVVRNGKERMKNCEIKDMWLSKLKDLLSDQEKILQQERNLKALSKWRLEKKLESPRKQSLETVPEVPYGTDQECDRILSRRDLTKQIDKMIKRSKKPNKKVTIEKLMNEIVDRMNALENSTDAPMTPTALQEKTEKQIQTIMDLQRKIMALQTLNNAV